MNSEKLITKDFVVISVINFLLFFGFIMMATIIALYIKYVGGSDTDAGLSIGIFTVSTLLIRPFAGLLLDRFGRRWVFLIGLVAMAALAYLYSFALAVVYVMAVRFLHGFSWGAASTGSNTIASDTIPKSRLGEGMGLFGLSNSLGMALGPGIGLIILGASDFKTLFLFSAVITLAALALSFCVKVKSREELREAAGSREVQTADNSTDHTVDTISVQKRKGAFFEKTALVPAVTIFFGCTTYGSLTGFLTLYGQQESIGNIGLYFTVCASAMLISRPIAGKLTDWKGFSVIVYPGLLLAGLAFFLLSGAHGLPQFLLSAAIYGIGFGAVQAALQTMAVINAPADRIGAANATFFNGFDAGIGAGSIIAGVVASYIGYSGMYLSFIIFIALAALFFFIMQIKRS